MSRQQKGLPSFAQAGWLRASVPYGYGAGLNESVSASRKAYSEPSTSPGINFFGSKTELKKQSEQYSIWFGMEYYNWVFHWVFAHRRACIHAGDTRICTFGRVAATNLEQRWVRTEDPWCDGPSHCLGRCRLPPVCHRGVQRSVTEEIFFSLGIRAARHTSPATQVCRLRFAGPMPG